MNVLVVILLIYLAAVNIAGFIIMGVDKSKAIKGRWRIPEKTFFIVSLAGGSAGSLVGMYVFHHKTRHWYFVVFIPLILAVQLVLALLLVTRVI